MRKFLYFVLLVLGLVAHTQVNAQKLTVKARIDSTILRIGSQTKLVFDVTQSQHQKVIFPLFSDSIEGGLEIVEQSKLDSITTSDGQLQVSQSYVVTAFNDSLLYIPAFPFVLDGDTVWSNSLSLKVVQPFKIDTASNTIADIKPLMNAKFDWQSFYRICLILFLIQVVLVIAYFLIKKYWQKAVGADEVSLPKLPPHVIALSKLDALKQEKLWQKGRPKEFHTELTEILRQYIEDVFKINSLEMTSDEILDHLRSLRFEQKAVYSSLKQILQLADLVKFAKWDTNPEEHELSLINAYLFVNQTKIEEVKPIEEQIIEQYEDLSKL
jgi:hypothetical protein